MPVVATLVAVGVVVVLIAVGWRQRWDPKPQDMPPVTLKSARADGDVLPLPGWYFAIALAGPLVLVASMWLGYRWNRPWMVGIGYFLFGSSWAARQAAILWRGAGSRLGRAAAVARPIALLAGLVAAGAARSFWPAVPAAVVYLAIPPVVDVVERRRGRMAVRSAPEPPRSG